MRLHEIRPGRVFKTPDRVVHLYAAPVSHHLETIDVGIFIISVHSRAERADSAALKLQAERRGRILPGPARIEGMAGKAG